MTDSEDILQYWFKGLNDGQPIDKSSPLVKWWFVKDEKIDREIREKFEDDLVSARHGEYAAWGQTAAGRLALVILFDQFPRNMYRNTPKMFETDPLALKLTLSSIAEKIDKQLQFIERTFLYMPLMHSEDLAVQKLSVRAFEGQVSECKERNIPGAYYEYNLGFAQKHHDIIAKFGRFPHRNTILQRVSTPEELEFLGKPGSSF